MDIKDLELRYDIIKLPSKGVFYENGCKHVKLYALTGADDGIITAPNLLRNGEIIDELLLKKVAPAGPNDPFIPPLDMLVGDRIALVLALRAVGIDRMFSIRMQHPKTGEEFTHDVDLTSLKLKMPDVEPDENGFFDFTFEKSFFKNNKPIPVNAKFRLMTGRDEKEIREEQKRTGLTENNYYLLKLTTLIQSIDGNSDKTLINQFLRQANLLEVRKLSQYINEVTPTYDFNITVPLPGGGEVTTFLNIGKPEFFFPGI